MKKFICVLAGSLSLIACSSMPLSSGQKAASSEPILQAASPDGSFNGDIIGDYQNSEFSALKIGMSKRQVEDLVGMPADHKIRQTSKAWIPIAGAFSQDQYRFEAYYKGAGRLVYARNGSRLFRIEVDKNEDGFR